MEKAISSSKESLLSSRPSKEPSVTEPATVPAPVKSMPTVLTDTLDLGSRGSFVFRELTVAENDTCREAATAKDESFNGRTMMRMMVTVSSVEPKLTLEGLTSLPQRVYARIVEFVNDLNDAESLDKDEDPGNA